MSMPDQKSFAETIANGTHALVRPPRRGARAKLPTQPLPSLAPLLPLPPLPVAELVTGSLALDRDAAGAVTAATFTARQAGALHAMEAGDRAAFLADMGTVAAALASWADTADWEIAGQGSPWVWQLVPPAGTAPAAPVDALRTRVLRGVLAVSPLRRVAPPSIWPQPVPPALLE